MTVLRQPASSIPAVLETVVIRAIEPELGNTLAVSAGVFCLFITSSFVTNFRVIVRSIQTVSIIIALPSVEDTAAATPLELVLGALVASLLYCHLHSCQSSLPQYLILVVALVTHSHTNFDKKKKMGKRPCQFSVECMAAETGWIISLEMSLHRKI